MTYNIIFLNSTPYDKKKVRGLAPYNLLEQAEKHNYTGIVFDFIESWTLDSVREAFDYVITAETKYLAFSLSWARTDTPRRYKPHHVGDYLLNNNFNTLINFAKTKNPNIKIICGGSNAVHANKFVINSVDHIFYGYGETQFVDFLKDPDRYEKIVNHDVKAYATHTDFDFANANPRIPLHSFVTPLEVLPLETARGCRFKCAFCTHPLIGNKDAASYIKDSNVIRDQLLYNYENFGVQKYSIQDDTFNDDNNKLKLYADVISSLPFKVYFWAYIRGDLLITNPEQINLLHEMGLSYCFMGIETYNQKAGKVVGKGIDPNRIKDMLHRAREVWKDDVYLKQGLIVGLPYEDKESIQNTVDFITGPGSPVDEAQLVPLVLRGKNLIGADPYVSDFERNPEKYGLTMQSDINYSWIKDDGTDIRSFEEAFHFCSEVANGKTVDLMDNAHSIYGPDYKKRMKLFFESSLDFAKRYSYDDVRNFTGANKIAFLQDCQQSQGKFDAMIQNHYVRPLLDHLQPFF